MAGKCPNCGYPRQSKDEGGSSPSLCPGCGIAYDGVDDQHANEIKRYGMLPAWLNFPKLTSIGFFMVAVLMGVCADKVPGGVIIAWFVVILALALGIVFYLFYLQAKAKFVAITADGLHVSGQGLIPWNEISGAELRCSTEEANSDVTLYSFTAWWIDLDVPCLARKKMKIAAQFDNITDLYSEIEKRMNRGGAGSFEPTDGNINRKPLYLLSGGTLSLIMGTGMIATALSSGPNWFDRDPKFVVAGFILFAAGIAVLIGSWKYVRQDTSM